MNLSVIQNLNQRQIYIFLATLGSILSIVLVWKHFTNASLPYCGGESCDVVLNSAWSNFLGVPLSLLGLLFYGSILILNIRQRKNSRIISTFLITTCFLISLYLLAVSILILNAICYYCLVSLLFVTGLFLVNLYYSKQKRPRLRGLLAGVVVVVVMHVSTAGVGFFEEEADPRLVILAKQLESNGAKFYGASWCEHCQAQKRLFGSAAIHLPYVECAPNGPQSARTTECLLKEINNYPTWIIDGRRFERVFPVEILANLSGYRLDEEDVQKR